MTNHDIDTALHDRNPDPLAERVLGRIESERIAPRPRWSFTVKNYVFWTLGALAVILGAFAIAATLFELTAVDWRLSAATHSDFISFFFSAAPILWIVALALFIGLGYANIRRTRHGYRYSLPVIALGAVLTSVTIGSILYFAGLGGRIEAAIGDHPPFYRPILIAERAWWSAPKHGLLLGDVTAVGPGIASFTLRDASGKDWTVDATELPERDLAAVARGGTLRVVGLPAGPAASPATTTPASDASSTVSMFHACFVFPWNAQQGGKPLPMPLAVLASTSARRATTVRNGPCKHILPYRALRDIDTAAGDSD